MTRRQEIENLVVDQARRRNVEPTYEALKWFTENYSQDHKWVGRYLYEEITVRSRKMFYTSAVKEYKNRLREYYGRSDV